MLNKIGDKNKTFNANSKFKSFCNDFTKEDRFEKHGKRESSNIAKINNLRKMEISNRNDGRRELRSNFLSASGKRDNFASKIELFKAKNNIMGKNEVTSFTNNNNKQNVIKSDDDSLENFNNGNLIYIIIYLPSFRF